MSKAAVVETTEQGTGIQKVTAGPERLLIFLKDVRQEMRKVITPTREQVQSTTIVVLITVFAFAAYFALVDQVIGRGIDQLLVHLTKR